MGRSARNSNQADRCRPSQEGKKTSVSEGLLRDIMEKKDLNKDGKISLDELTKAVADERWLKQHLEKGVTAMTVTDAMVSGKSGSKMCAVM